MTPELNDLRYQNIYGALDNFLKVRPEGKLIIYDFRASIDYHRIMNDRPDLVDKLYIVTVQKPGDGKPEIALYGVHDQHIMIMVNP